MVYNNKKHDTETQKAEMFDAVEWNPFYCSNALKNLLRPRCMPHTYVSFWCRNKMHMHGMAYPAHVRKHENVLPLKQGIFSHAWDSSGMPFLIRGIMGWPWSLTMAQSWAQIIKSSIWDFTMLLPALYFYLIYF